MEKLLEILKGIRPDVDFENEDALIDDGILDSFDVVSIISEIDDNYDVQIRISELDPENFNSVKSIWTLIQSLKQAWYNMMERWPEVNLFTTIRYIRLKGFQTLSNIANL